MKITVNINDAHGNLKEFNRQLAPEDYCFCLSAISMNRIFEREIQVTEICRVSYWPGLEKMEIYCRGEIKENAPRPSHA